MDGGINNLLSTFLNNPEMMKKATDLMSRLSAASPAEEPAQDQPAVPAMAVPAVESEPPPKEKDTGGLGNMSNDQLAAMVSSVISALGMNPSGQTPSPDDTDPSPSVQSPQDTPDPPEGDAIPAANFDIERTLGVLKNVSSETSPQKDNRIQLLLSLKPFMKDGRKQKIDMAVKYLNAAKVFNMFGKNGFI